MLHLFKYKEDRLPTLLFCVYFLLDLSVFFWANHWAYVVAWMLIGIIPKGYICAWNHHHQHCFTFRQAPLNRFLELVFFFQTGISSYLWVLHHVVGHHMNYLDQKKDESRWQRKDGTQMGVLEYTLSVTFTAYYRALKVGQKHPKYQSPFLIMGALSFSLLGVFFWINWMNALFVFAIPMFISLTITSWATYDHHAGKTTESKYAASNNIIEPFYNRLSGNLGYHTAHHTHFGAHWSQLPEIHKKIAHKIPAECYHEPAISPSLSKLIWKIPHSVQATVSWAIALLVHR